MFAFRRLQLVNALRKIASVFRSFSQEPPKKLEKTINIVTLLGRVGVNPQIRGSEQRPVVTFSLATHVNYKVESGDWAQRTDWHQVAVFRPDLRESTMNYVSKGKRLLVYGRITHGEYKDPEGNSRQVTSIVADDITFLQSFAHS